MSEFGTPPRTGLLDRLRNPTDHQAWEDFIAAYGPLIRGFGNRYGLQDADAVDFAQNVLRSVLGAVRANAFDPERGTFQNFLLLLTRTELYKFFEQKQREVGQGTGDTDVHLALDQNPVSDPKQEEWNQEYHKHLLIWAVGKVREFFRDITWEAFWQTAVLGRDPQEVADELGIKVSTVYSAKSRVMERIKREVGGARGEVDL